MSSLKIHLLAATTFALILSVVTGQNSTSCVVKVKSNGPHVVICSVTRNACIREVTSGTLFSPPVGNLTVVVHQDVDSGHYTHSTASFSWNSPEKFHITGFLIHVQGSKNQSCYHVMLEGQKIPAGNVLFELSLPLLRPGDYAIKVHSISDLGLVSGSSSLVPHSIIIVKSRNDDYQGIPALWTTDLVLINDSCNNSITVSFELAPKRHKFISYIIKLQSNDTEEIVSKAVLNVTRNQTQGNFTFFDVVPGSYIVLVTPEDDLKGTPQCRCKCKKFKRGFCSNSPCPDVGCLVLNSSVLTIDNVDCTLDIHDPLSVPKWLGLAGGGFLGLLCIVAILYVLLRPKHIDFDLMQSEHREVFLLSTNDNDVNHQKNVSDLIHFLENHCNCFISTVRTHQREIAENLIRFIVDLLDSDTRILIINSAGMASNLKDTNPTIGDLDDNTVNVILKFFQQGNMCLQENENITVARFRRTESNDLPKQLHYRKHEYVLSNDLESLVLRLHGFERRNGRSIYHVKNFPPNTLEADNTDNLVGCCCLGLTDNSVSRADTVSSQCTPDVMSKQSTCLTERFISPSVDSLTVRSTLEGFRDLFPNHFNYTDTTDDRDEQHESMESLTPTRYYSHPSQTVTLIDNTRTINDRLASEQEEPNISLEQINPLLDSFISPSLVSLSTSSMGDFDEQCQRLNEDSW